MSRVGNAVSAFAIFSFLVSSDASASLLNFEATVTKPLLYVDGGQSIGGPEAPVIFDFSIDSNAPNYSGRDDAGRLFRHHLKCARRYGSHRSVR